MCGSLLLVLAACGDQADSHPPVEGSLDDEAEKQSAPSASATATTPPGPIMDPAAIDLLKAMTSSVAGLSAFRVTLETGFDVLQPTGQKLEFGSRRTAAIQRPDRARFSYQERSGRAGELIFSGSDIYAYDREHNVYATVEQPGDIDAALDLVTSELGIPVPMNDFFAADPASSLSAGVLEARDLGPSTIDGQPGHHVALRKPGVDYQIWISEANQLPMRVVITFLESPDQPQFWGQFLSWETDPDISANTFDFSPPEGSQRIRFGLPDATADPAAGSES